MRAHYRIALAGLRFVRSSTLDYLPQVGVPGFTLSLRVKEDEPGFGFHVAAIEYAPDLSEVWLTLEYHKGEDEREQLRNEMLATKSLWHQF